MVDHGSPQRDPWTCGSVPALVVTPGLATAVMGLLWTHIPTERRNDTKAWRHMPKFFVLIRESVERMSTRGGSAITYTGSHAWTIKRRRTAARTLSWAPHPRFAPRAQPWRWKRERKMVVPLPRIKDVVRVAADNRFAGCGRPTPVDPTSAAKTDARCSRMLSLHRAPLATCSNDQPNHVPFLL